MTSQTRPSVARRIVEVVIAIVLFCPIIFCGLVSSAVLLSEPLARSMKPPLYPNGQLLGTKRATNARQTVETSVYSTADTLATVDNWFVSNASTLKRTLMSNGDIVFTNPASDGFLPRIVGYLNRADWGGGPSISLTLQPDPDNAQRTQITLVVSWPTF